MQEDLIALKTLTEVETIQSAHWRVMDSETAENNGWFEINLC